MLGDVVALVGSLDPVGRMEGSRRRKEIVLYQRVVADIGRSELWEVKSNGAVM